MYVREFFLSHGSIGCRKSRHILPESHIKMSAAQGLNDGEGSLTSKQKVAEPACRAGLRA
ncbi:hypothetical protein COHCIP112018_00906 [Cohnella sp. JJ-181]|nr:hypothetical protein COHCIP112018_00906 [Cohnella sp. JJ-181]